MRLVPERKQKEARLSPLKRKIHIGKDIWTYQMSHSGVKVRTPDRTKSFYVDAAVVAKTDQYNWERGLWKGYSRLTPGMVRDYIMENLLK